MIDMCFMTMNLLDSLRPLSEEALPKLKSKRRAFESGLFTIQSEVVAPGSCADELLVATVLPYFSTPVHFDGTLVH